ncbi:MAG: MMPL family transporter [Solirubrobacteraceae bacterium]|nr:MMPL family transporter [Solirubrobacteraceae bacterium]
MSASPESPPPQTTSLARLASAIVRRRAVVLGAWVVALVAVIGLAPTLAGEWSADYTTPGSDSKSAEQLIDARFPDRSTSSLDVVWQTAAGTSAAAADRRVDAVLAKVQGLERVGDGITAADAQRSADGRTAVVRVPLDDRPANVAEASGEQLVSLAKAGAGAGVTMAFGGQVMDESENGAISSEGIGLLLALVILLVTFGSVVAAGLPMLTALFGLGIAGGLITVLAAFVDTPDWAEQVAAMVGIGVGIDYALLIVTRYRSSLSAGMEPEEAIVEATSTAGRSVLIAGTTVVVSMLGLFLMGLPYLYGVALSTSLAVLVVMLASITLLPALLALAGRKIERLHIPGARRSAGNEGAVAARFSGTVQRRPWAAIALGLLAVGALALPVTGLRLGFPDSGNDTAERQTRQAYDLIAQGFGTGANGPLLVVADVGANGEAKIAELGRGLQADGGVAGVSEPVISPDGKAVLFTVQPKGSPQATATEDLVHELRDEVVPASRLDAHVGGFTASTVDQSEATAARLPLFIAGVVGLSSLLLLIAFRSVLIPVKAAAMNLLSIGAAYGIVALVAQGGTLGSLVGIDTPTPVAPWIPVMMFAVLFGLSMDYEVFLLGRIREAWLRDGDAQRAITEGVGGTARVITAAAAIMIAVFGAFALSPEIPLKLVGVGMATAILVDATIIRMVLVPALMQLMGSRTWWLPSWLDRVVPHAELEPAPAR